MRYGIAKRFLCDTNGDGYRDGKAALSGAAEGAVADDLRGEFHVCVGKNDDVIFCAALALHALAACGRTRVNVLGDGRGTDKADGADLRVITERVDNIFAAVDEIDDAFGEAGFFEEFERADHA